MKSFVFILILTTFGSAFGAAPKSCVQALDIVTEVEKLSNSSSELNQFRDKLLQKQDIANELEVLKQSAIRHDQDNSRYVIQGIFYSLVIQGRSEALMSLLQLLKTSKSYSSHFHFLNQIPHEHSAYQKKLAAALGEILVRHSGDFEMVNVIQKVASATRDAELSEIILNQKK